MYRLDSELTRLGRYRLLKLAYLKLVFKILLRHADAGDISLSNKSAASWCIHTEDYGSCRGKFHNFLSPSYTQ